MFKTLQFTLFFLCLCGFSSAAFAQNFEAPSPAAFANALELGDIKQAEKWLNEGLPVDFEGSRIGTGLHFAAWEGNIPLIQLYLARGADVNLLNRHKETPLALAAWRGQKKAMEFLIENGAAINTAPYSWSPLHYAVFSGQGEIVDSLLKDGADVNALSSNGSSPLMMAVYEGRADMITKLVDAGASTQVKNDRGESAVDWAMRRDRVDLAKMIASPKELAEILSRPKSHWTKMRRSMASSAMLEKLLEMRKELIARGHKTAAIDRRIAGERKAIIERDFEAGFAQRVEMLEISAKKGAPEKQKVQIKKVTPKKSAPRAKNSAKSGDGGISLNRNSGSGISLKNENKALPLDSRYRSGSPAPIPPRTLRND